MKKVVVVGAGLGGLTAAALLAREGLDVTVLESHIYPGGCAGTFYYQGYRFDAGATLAGGFHPGGPMRRLGDILGIRWPSLKTDPAMVAHLSNGDSISLYADARRWDERGRVFGSAANEFWHWQERTADALWDLAERNPLWPPQRPGELFNLAGTGLRWALADLPNRFNGGLLADAVTTLGRRTRHLSPEMKEFLDGQLLISAQTTRVHANALYAAAALDLPRRGVVHLAGGMGAIAERLVSAITAAGGRVHYRSPVERILFLNGRPAGVETVSGDRWPADQVILNLPPWNIADILGKSAPRKLRRLPPKPQDGWGAFTIYLGIPDGSALAGQPIHQQVLTGSSLQRGDSVFLSISPEGDLNRAPLGARAVTISTHTDLDSWWQLYESDRGAYNARKNQLTDVLLQSAEIAIPGLRDAAELILPGTPVTFERFTRRHLGWVGGFPQKSLFSAWGPRLGSGIWMVGDSIFPGQSTAAVALGGMRVSGQILDEIQGRRPKPVIHWGEASGPYAYQPAQSRRKQRN
ncbi:MAG: NAD(P)/FAD-dependent oxidoreductase [Anaerolineales bacterium]|nr:NAD(P)/FAD-dependent oxidoreductase [Anaerolineales bacterium]